MEKQRRTSSIVWRMNVHYQMDRFFRVLGMDVTFLCAVVLTYLYAAESSSAAGFHLHSTRRFFLGSVQYPEALQKWFRHAPEWLMRLSRLSYKVVSPKGESAFIHAGTWACVAGVVFLILIIVQLVTWAASWMIENGRLRAYLKPIDELAFAAERLSQGSFSEESLQKLEHSLDQIDRTDARVSIGDHDLMGLENAINNLLTRLQKSYQAQTRFVDDASHELRTPVAVIQGYASMLERWGMDDRKTLEESVHAIREESDHMKTLIDQLLFLARGDMGRQKFQMERLDAREIMKEIREESEMIDETHPYECLADEEVPVMAERAMLKQAVRILVDNAAKYTPASGKITLRARVYQDQALLEVQDEGMGIKKQEAEHIFERFFRGDDARGSTKGSGLGLSIARWIVEKHGGEISVFSIPDMGARFTISLKRASHADAALE